MCGKFQLIVVGNRRLLWARLQFLSNCTSILLAWCAYDLHLWLDRLYQATLLLEQKSTSFWIKTVSCRFLLICTSVHCPVVMCLWRWLSNFGILSSVLKDSACAFIFMFILIVNVIFSIDWVWIGPVEWKALVFRYSCCLKLATLCQTWLLLLAN